MVPNQARSPWCKNASATRCPRWMGYYSKIPKSAYIFDCVTTRVLSFRPPIEHLIRACTYQCTGFFRGWLFKNFHYYWFLRWSNTSSHSCMVENLFAVGQMVYLQWTLHHIFPSTSWTPCDSSHETFQMLGSKWLLAFEHWQSYGLSVLRKYSRPPKSIGDRPGHQSWINSPNHHLRTTLLLVHLSEEFPKYPILCDKMYQRF